MIGICLPAFDRIRSGVHAGIVTQAEYSEIACEVGD